MAFPNKVKIPISTNRVSSHDLSCSHITTGDFMQFSVAKAMELVPRQTIKVNQETFARLAPMPIPTFGFANIINRAYFVPFRTIFPGWNSFITDTPHVFENGDYEIPTIVPHFNVSSLNYLFLHMEDYSYETEVDSSADIIYVDGNSQVLRMLSPLGRFALKLLRSLGYNWTFNSAQNTMTFSALPLLAAARIYMDYYYPAAYANDEESAWVNSLFVRNYNNEQVGELSSTDLKRLFAVLYRVAYEDDYYTSAWDNPNGPNPGLSSTITITDPQNIGPDGESDTSLYVKNITEEDSGITNVIAAEEGSAIYRLTQFTLTALRGLSDYMKRHQLSGSRTIDRYLSRFGIKLRDEKLNRSVFIGEHRQNLQFGDVTATADTEGAHLGSYSGKGVSYGSGNFEFSTDEYGMFIIISVIKPKIGYFENVIPQTRHIYKTDFFTPEFDNLGTQPITNYDVYNTMDGRNYSSISNPSLFGFTPRYSEYKVPFDQLTGDFVLKSFNSGMDSWYMLRSLKPFVSSVNGVDNLRHSYDFVIGKDADQYNRIFYSDAEILEADKFHVIHSFDIKSNFPGKSLYDTYEFENEDDASKVTIPLNGTQH